MKNGWVLSKMETQNYTSAVDEKCQCKVWIMAPANITRADTIDNSTNAFTSVERKHMKRIRYLRKKGFQQRSIEHNKLTF